MTNQDKKKCSETADTICYLIDKFAEKSENKAEKKEALYNAVISSLLRDNSNSQIIAIYSLLGKDLLNDSTGQDSKNK
jgi:hypothetical protein